MNNQIEHGAEGTEPELEEGHNETRVYELGFHIDPELPTEEAKKTYQSIKEKVASVGQLIAEGEPQKIPLAYTISRQEHGGRRDFNSAFFAWVAYEADGAGHDVVNEMARTDTRLVRFLDLRTTKDAAKHAAEMHEMYAQMPQKPAGEDEVSEVELDAALKEAGAA